MIGLTVSPGTTIPLTTQPHEKDFMDKKWFLITIIVVPSVAAIIIVGIACVRYFICLRRQEYQSIY